MSERGILGIRHVFRDGGYNVKMLDMKNCKTWIVATALFALAGLGGCGTIVFFPYEAAERAADKVLDDILSGNGGQEEPAKDSESKKP